MGGVDMTRKVKRQAKGGGLKRWQKFWRGYGSNHGDSGQSGDGWYCTSDRVVAAEVAQIEGRQR